MGKKAGVEDYDGYSSGMSGRLYDQLVAKDNWEIVDEIDTFGYIFDRMPQRMKLTVDLRSSGYSIKDIAKMMGVGIDAVYVQLRKAKKRLLVSKSIL